MYGPERVARVAAKLTGKTYGPRPEAWRAAISAAKKGRSNGLEGRPKSPETRAKIAAAHTGTRSANWKGDDVGYIALHERARKVMASECAHCGTTERLEAALRKDAAGPLKHATMRIAGKDRDMTYSTTLSDYMALCVPCHRVYDLKAS